MRSERENSQIPQEARGSILVIEPDDRSRAAMLAWLVDAGFEVHAASDGQQCLEKLNVDGSDLVLLSLQSSDPAGVEDFRRFKTHAAEHHPPVVCLTEKIDDDTLQMILDAGGYDFVHKPVRRVELLTRVQTVLDRTRAIRVRRDHAQLQDVLAAAGIACHDLNQPLQYVMGIVQVLMMDFSPGDDMYEQLDGVRARIEEMGGITRKLTDLTRPRTGKMALPVGSPADSPPFLTHRS